MDKNKFVSAYYIKEKMWPITQMISIVNEACDNGKTNNIADQLSESQRRDIAFAFATIAKELDVKIPDV